MNYYLRSCTLYLSIKIAYKFYFHSRLHFLNMRRILYRLPSAFPYYRKYRGTNDVPVIRQMLGADGVKSVIVHISLLRYSRYYILHLTIYRSVAVCIV